jgi:hypothetical protein
LSLKKRSDFQNMFDPIIINLKLNDNFKNPIKNL